MVVLRTVLSCYTDCWYGVSDMSRGLEAPGMKKVGVLYYAVRPILYCTVLYGVVYTVWNTPRTLIIISGMWNVECGM